MRKTFHIIYIIFGIISFAAAIQGMLTEDMIIFGLSMYCSIFAFLVAFMAEPRPRETEQDRKHDDRCQSWGVGMLLIVTIAGAMTVFMGI